MLALAVAAAVYLAGAPRTASLRVRRLAARMPTGSPPGTGQRDGGGPASQAPDRADALRRGACWLTGAAAWLLIGGLLGAAVGAALALAGPVLLGRLETGESRRRHRSPGRSCGRRRPARR
jgi:hypothetical protein